MPLPSGDRSKLTGEGASDQKIRLLDYRRQMSAAVFIPLLLVLIGLPVAAALLAGFEVSRRRDAGTAPAGAAWGALVGPVWALAGVLAIALTQKELFGRPQGDAVFVTLLLGGAALGALGGLLAAQRRSAGAPAQRAKDAPAAVAGAPHAAVEEPTRAAMPAGEAPTAPAGPDRAAPRGGDAPTVLEPPGGAPKRRSGEGRGAAGRD